MRTKKIGQNSLNKEGKNFSDILIIFMLPKNISCANSELVKCFYFYKL